MESLKKILKETKEKKEEQNIQHKLIESRLKFILGDQKIIKMTEEDQFKLSFQVFEEIHTLSNQGLLNENNLLQVFKGLFGDDVHSLPKTFYKPWIDNVLKTLNMNDSYLKEYLVSRLTKEPTEVWSSFESCEKMSRMIAKALSETLILHLRMDKDFTGLDDAKRTLEDSIRQEEFIKKLQIKIQSVICHLFDKYATNASDVMTKLKK